MRRQLEYDRIEQASESAIGVLLKMYCFPESDSMREWTIAVYEVFHSVHKVGLFDRYLPADKIYLHSLQFNYHLIRPLIDTYIKVASDGYYEDVPRKYIDYKEPVTMISKYFLKLSDKLHELGAVSLNDVERYLRMTGFVRY